MKKKIVVRREVNIWREEDAMTITLTNADAKTTRYFVDGRRCSKGVAEVIVASYILRDAVENHASVIIDERLSTEFKAITDSPYLGEFRLFYSQDGVQTKAFDAQETATADRAPRRYRIVMFGDKTPLFEIHCNGHVISTGGPLRKSTVDAWVIDLYRKRKCYPNLSLSVSHAAACFLDTLSVNPQRILDGLNVTLEKSDWLPRQGDKVFLPDYNNNPLLEQG